MNVVLAVMRAYRLLGVKDSARRFLSEWPGVTRCTRLFSETAADKDPKTTAVKTDTPDDRLKRVRPNRPIDRRPIRYLLSTAG